MLRRTGRRARSLVALFAAVLAIGLAAPAANAALVGVKGGQAALTVDFQNFYFKLGQSNIYTIPIAPAEVDFNTGQLRLPVKDGLIETGSMLGVANLDGGLRIVKYNSNLSAIEKEITINGIRILNGSTLVGNAFGLVPSPSADFKNTAITNPDSGTTVFKAGDVRVNALAAPVLNLYFGGNYFEGGMRMGSFSATIEH